MKLMVVKKHFAFLKQSITMLTSLLRSGFSIFSSARSLLAQKSISCEVAPDVTSRSSLVMV